MPRNPGFLSTHCRFEFRYVEDSQLDLSFALIFDALRPDGFDAFSLCVSLFVAFRISLLDDVMLSGLRNSNRLQVNPDRVSR